jgi:hypothetical protein
MARLKVLFADDQISDDDTPDSGIISVMGKRYPNDPNFVQAFWEMRQTVKILRDGAGNVHTLYLRSILPLTGGSR